MSQSADQYFAIIPESVLYADISHGAVRVYGVLRRHADKDNGTCHPGRKRIAELANMGTRSVDRAINELEQIGAVEVSHRRNPDNPEQSLSNVYRVLTPRAPDYTPRAGDHTPLALVTTPPRAGGDLTRVNKPESVNQRNTRSTVVDPMFETFWENYPRKVGRKKCFEWWVRNAPLIGDHIVDSLDAWCLYWGHAVTDNRYIPHPYTWLNQERFDDPPPQIVNQRTDTVLAVLETINQQQPALEAHNDPF